MFNRRSDARPLRGICFMHPVAWKRCLRYRIEQQELPTTLATSFVAIPALSIPMVRQ